MWTISVVLPFSLVALFVSNISCLSEKDETAIRNTLEPLIEKCLEVCGLKEIKLEDDDIDPCLKKCFVKTLHVIDDKGQLDRDVLHDMFKEYVEDKAESMKKKNVFEACFDEKNRSVTEDADAEVKRIDIIFECLEVIAKE